MVNISEYKDAYENPAQRELLLKLFSNEFVQRNFFLTGGSALSIFYAGHRRSRDLDLFLIKETNLLEYTRFFRHISFPDTIIYEGPTGLKQKI